MYGVDSQSVPIALLLIEKDHASIRSRSSQLEGSGLNFSIVAAARDVDDPRVHDDSTPWDIVILSCDDMQDTIEDQIRTIKDHHPQCSIIVLSAQSSLSQAVTSMREGADDFLVTPVSAAQLTAAIKRSRKPRERAAPGSAAPDTQNAQATLIGSSKAMQALTSTLERAASSKATVFLKGESGTGKELCAQAVHAMSPRAGGPLISLNCSAIPRELMESEIFGHEKGAFTGATHRREGAAELADGGTLFLDEICEMDLALQAKLLRFIQTGQFTRVGGSQLKTVDLRFVCATNRDPMEAVRSGAFREDLFYRLHVLPVDLPPLRERENDMLEIARHALVHYAREEGKAFRRLDGDVEQLLSGYWWPGNVRELLNVIRNIVVMNDGDVVTPEMLPLALARSAAPSAVDDVVADMVQLSNETAHRPASRRDDLFKPLWRHEQDIIESVIAACGGNIGKAAAHLDINPSTIYRKRQSWAQQGVA